MLWVVLLASACALAQAPARVRGTITAVDENTLTVDGKTQVRLGDKTEIVSTQPIGLADIKPGDFLAMTSRKAADGRLTAYEVRRFPKPLNRRCCHIDAGAGQPRAAGARRRGKPDSRRRAGRAAHP